MNLRMRRLMRPLAAIVIVSAAISACIGGA